MGLFDLKKREIVQKRMMDMLAPRPPLTDTEPMHLQLACPEGQSMARALVRALTDDEKLTLVSGTEGFCIPGVPRLGLKPVWTSDATMGLRGWKAKVTDFPATVAMAATFDRALVGKAGSVIGNECRALGVDVLLGPGVNIARVPTCGRNFEYCGEDPYLAGEIAASYIQGVQGQGVIATVKHYACNNSDYDRHKCNSVVDERTLREIYLPAFKKAVDSGVLGVMTAYNLVNGTYCSEHPYLVEAILRDEWGFGNLVISDWDSLYSTVPAVLNGVDLEMPGPKWFGPDKLGAALESGQVSMADIERKLLHLFGAYEKAGLFSRPRIDTGAKAGTPAHEAVARSVAEESVVLLKNEDSLLPLRKHDGYLVCVGGRNAFATPAGGGSAMIQLPEEPENLAGQLLAEGVEAVFLPAAWWRHRRYREAVSRCNAVVFSTGFDHLYESESYDRQWTLPGKEAEEIRRIAELNKNLVVILHGGGDMETSSWLSSAKAVLHAFYLGSRTAPVLADLLFGRRNPSGKLPFSMAKELSDYRSVSHYPDDFASLRISHLQSGQGNPQKRSVWDMTYSEGLMVGYRLFDTERIDVAFPFGHGLSYTDFAYSGLRLQPKEDGSVAVSLLVENRGGMPGREVVQVYVHESMPDVFRPEQELKQFCSVFLEPGEKREFSMDLPPSAFCHYDIDRWAFVRGSGSFEIRVGSSSRDIRLRGVV
jgi:beta-glucosidase